MWLLFRGFLSFEHADSCPGVYNRKNMKKGLDISVNFPGLYLVHHNLPGFLKQELSFKDHLLFIPIQGEISLDVSDRTFTLGPGRMLYLPPNVRHSLASSRFQGERLIALVDQKLWDKRIGKAFSASVIPLSQLVKEIIFYLLLRPKTKHLDSLLSVFAETLGEILDLTPKFEDARIMEHLESRVQDFRTILALNYMKANFSRSISMNEVAKKAGLSLRSLNRLILQETGFTPRSALIRYRISKAQELLLTPGASVTAVALDVGYSSLSQFISAFRSVTGQLPSEYAKLASFRNP